MARPTQAQGREKRRPGDEAAEASGPRKPCRRDPERRRQQNLQAQKRHREKIKERLACLEALHGRAMQDPCATDTPNLHQSAAASLPPMEGLDASAAVVWLGQPGEKRGAGVPGDDQASALDAWDPVVHVDPFLVHRLRCHDTTTAAAAAADPLCTTPLACSCGDTHAALVQTRATPSGLVLHLDPGRRDRAAAAATGDPYANHLRVEALCTIAALEAAGGPLGLTPGRVCRPGAGASPFARPGADAGARAAAARLFASLPRDLRPGAAQIARPHPPVIDVLPFPTLRRNLVVAGWGPGLELFFLDLLVGLVCWGADGGGGGGGEARPWEARAWEARPWFLRKYWALLGGEAGELVRQSARWRTARGEFAGLVGV